MDYRVYDEWSRWPLRAIPTGTIEADGHPVYRYWVELSSPTICPGTQSCLIIDVTDCAADLLLNQGEIDPKGRLIWGPGEVEASVGSEGRYCYVRLKDGKETVRTVETIAVTVSLAG